MAIKYKCDILNELKNKGFTTYKIRKEKLLSEGTLTKLRTNDTAITLNNISVICELLDCQPSDLIEYVPD
jgi:putative transcriptional regulator